MSIFLKSLQFSQHGNLTSSLACWIPSLCLHALLSMFRTLGCMSSSRGAVSILDSVPQDADVDHANYMCCVSGIYYNIAGSLYQATRYGAAVLFLREACLLGTKALSMKGHGKGKGKVWKCRTFHSRRSNDFHFLFILFFLRIFLFDFTFFLFS